MENTARDKLHELVVKHGQTLAEDPRRCGALLRDTAGSHRKEIAVLVAAAEEGIPADLLNPSVETPSAVLFVRLQQRLEQERGLASDVAKWAVESWAFALGVYKPPLGRQETPRREVAPMAERANSRPVHGMDRSRRGASPRFRRYIVFAVLAWAWVLALAVWLKPVFYITLVFGVGFGVVLPLVMARKEARTAPAGEILEPRDLY